MRRLSSLPAVCLLGGAALGLSLAPTAQAATAYYLFIPKIPGEVPAGPHKDWIAVNGVTQAVTSPPSSGTGATLAEAVVAKFADRATPLLAVAVASRTAVGNVTIDVVDAASGAVNYRIMLRDVYLSALSESSGDGDEAIYDTLSLNFTKIAWSYTQSGGGQTQTTSFDATTQQGAAGPLPTSSVDSDGDGVSDDYEISNGLNPYALDASGDLDGDGASNRSEFIAGTRANDPKSVFRVSGASLAGGAMQITWNSVAGKKYSLWGSATPAGPFTLVQANIASAGDGQAGSGKYFYRVQTP